MARGGVAESVDARDLKSFGQKCLWGFKSPRPHQSRRGLNRSHIPVLKAEDRGAPLDPFRQSNVNHFLSVPEGPDGMTANRGSSKQLHRPQPPDSVQRDKPEPLQGSRT